MKKAKLTRSYRSFIEAYKPKYGIIVTQGLIAEEIVDGCRVQFIPLAKIEKMYDVISKSLELT